MIKCLNEGVLKCRSLCFFAVCEVTLVDVESELHLELDHMTGASECHRCSNASEMC